MSPVRVFRAGVPARVLITDTTLVMVKVEVVLVESLPRPNWQSHNQVTQAAAVILGGARQVGVLVVVATMWSLLCGNSGKTEPCRTYKR